MTNDKFKPTFKQPFIPKTETRIFLGGRPIDQQAEKTGSKGIGKQHYQSERTNEINPGYEPCLFSSDNCSITAILICTNGRSKQEKLNRPTLLGENGILGFENKIERG